MERLTAKRIKKIILGIVLTDGCIDRKHDRFEFYSKPREYAEYVADVVSQVTGMYANFRIREDKRGYIGHRVFTRNHVYWGKMRKYTYSSCRKELTSYAVARIDAEALAHMWMCDGYLEHAKNRKLGRVQNVGWFCLEAFPKEELQLFKDHLEAKWGIEVSFSTKPWGFGYRIRVGGVNLQKLISLMYPYILDCFNYKTPLFYRERSRAELTLPNAEHFIKKYDEIEDIVRHLKKLKET